MRVTSNFAVKRDRAPPDQEPQRPYIQFPAPPYSVPGLIGVIPTMVMVTAIALVRERGTMVRSAGLMDLWPEPLALVVFASVAMWIATLRVHGRLD